MILFELRRLRNLIWPRPSDTVAVWQTGPTEAKVIEIGGKGEIIALEKGQANYHCQGPQNLWGQGGAGQGSRTTGPSAHTHLNFSDV
jgi:hypothetical protein